MYCTSAVRRCVSSADALWFPLPAAHPLQGSDYISSLSLGDEHDGGSFTPSSHGHTLSGADMDPAMREAMVANAAAAAVSAFASAAAATGSGGGGCIAEQAAAQLPPMPPGSHLRNGTSDAGEVALSSRQSGSNSPPKQYPYLPGRPPSFHDLARAMREFHEQQMAEMAEAREAAARANAAAAAAANAAPLANGVGGHGVGELSSYASGTLSTPLDSPPLVEVKLPNGALNPAVLAKVAATAAAGAAAALNEVMGGPHQMGPTPVCTIASYSNCKEEHS